MWQNHLLQYESIQIHALFSIIQLIYLNELKNRIGKISTFKKIIKEKYFLCETGALRVSRVAKL
jgi:hypothetical protein